MHKIYLYTIMYICSRDNYVLIFTDDGRMHDDLKCTAESLYLKIDSQWKDLLILVRYGHYVNTTLINAYSKDEMKYAEEQKSRLHPDAQAKLKNLKPSESGLDELGKHGII